MKFKKLLLSLLSIVILASCTSSTEPEDNTLVVKMKKESMKVTNKFDETVYVFVVDRDAANVIDWIPSYDGPNIHAYETVEIKFSEVAGVEMSHSTNNDILIYYWTKTDADYPKVESIIVTPSNY